MIRFPASVEQGKKRAIASKIDQVDNGGDQSGASVYWLIAFLAIAGGVFRFHRTRNA